jgi:O-antigen ligase
LFKTASRGGFITLVAAGAVCLWYFGVKGKRFFLIAASAFTVLILMSVAGGNLKDRFSSMWSDDMKNHQEKTAYESYEDRRFLMQKAIEGIKHYPILGIGVQNFETYSTEWREVHMTYLQIAVEGGIPSLILYLMFFARGFSNLRKLLKRKDLSPELNLFTGALYSSLIGFVIGALFSPEAYQFFPYFAVAYSSALLAIVRESDRTAVPVQQKKTLPMAGRPYVRPTRIPVSP